MDARIAAVRRGVVAGLLAGVPQVLAAQAVEKALALSPERADIGPRFVERLANQLGTSLPPAARWLLSAVFHFGYSAWWGGLYGLLDSQLKPSPGPGGLVLGAVIWTAAFSPIGGGTKTGTERHPRRRGVREHALHLTAAFSFSLTTAYACEWLARATGERDDDGTLALRRTRSQRGAASTPTGERTSGG